MDTHWLLCVLVRFTQVPLAEWLFWSELYEDACDFVCVCGGASSAFPNWAAINSTLPLWKDAGHTVIAAITNSQGRTSLPFSKGPSCMGQAGMCPESAPGSPRRWTVCLDWRGELTPTRWAGGQQGGAEAFLAASVVPQPACLTCTQLQPHSHYGNLRDYPASPPQVLSPSKATVTHGPWLTLPLRPCT